MRTKFAFMLTGMVALSLLSPLGAADRDRRDERRGPERSHRDERRADRRDDRRGPGHHWDGPRHDVWSHHRPRPHYRVRHMPPPMRHEFRSFCPSPHHVWIAGYWTWREPFGNWFWNDGYWMLPPSPNVVYVGPRYVEVNGGVEYVDGGWCESDYASDVNDGAVTGAVLGGVAGGIIGHQSKNTGAGVVIGALVGTVIGHQADNAKAEARVERREIAEQRAAAELERQRAETERLKAEAAAAHQQAAADAELHRKAQIVLGEQTTEADLAAAQERARVAKEKLATAKAAQQDAQSRAQAMQRANAEAAAAEAELEALENK